MSDANNKSYGRRRREENWEAMRERIRGMQLLNRIEADLERPLERGEIGEVKFKTETRLKLLNKVLPDLAAVRVDGPGDDGEHEVVHVFKWKPSQKES